MYWSKHMKVKSDKDIAEWAVIWAEYIIEHNFLSHFVIFCRNGYCNFNEFIV